MSTKYLYFIPLLLLVAYTGEEPIDNDYIIENAANETQESDFYSDNEESISVNEIFSENELTKLRKLVVKQSKIFDYYSHECYYAPYGEMAEDDTEAEYDCGKYPYEKLKKEDTTYLLNAINKVMNRFDTKINSITPSQFAERMKYVFGIDIDTLNTKNGYWNKDTYYGEGELFPHIYTFDFSHLYFIYDGIFYSWFEFDPQHSDAYIDDDWEKDCFTRCLPGYTKYYETAIKDKYKLVVRKRNIANLSHINNYLFRNDPTSFDWLMNNCEDFLHQLYNIGFDKDPRINKKILDDMLNDNETYNREDLFCNFNKYLGFSDRVRTGMMRFIVDNCHEEQNYISTMHSCFEYYIEQQNIDPDRIEKTYEICAYLGYYMQKAYDNYVSHGNKAQKNWQYALKQALKKDQKKNKGKFIRYVRDHQYMELEGYKEIFEKAVAGK